MKKSILFIFLIALSFAGNAQFAVNYYYDGNTIGISTNPEKGHWLEFRMNTVPYIFSDWYHSQRGIPQAYFCFKLISDGKASLYSGVGAGIPFPHGEINTVNVNIPFGLQLNPINQLPRLYLTAEYTPMFDVLNEMEITNTLSVGFRYVFSKEKF
ncbi:MAG: hypothetical protein Q8S54_06755 [Bacteroidota bacterium]|nr:hypothetical protein [Odoribacter sp.]MDP3642876.1 hypothetical protein [Bacteroidota bacterium]